MFSIKDFVRESNKIEGLLHEPTSAELDVHEWFRALNKPSVGDLSKFVSIVQQGALLRNKAGMGVRVGRYFPPEGGKQIEVWLTKLLNLDCNPYQRHVEYQLLHPFTDGNGRSGRVLWLHDMGGVEEAPLGFLHTFYYQTLEEAA